MDPQQVEAILRQEREDHVLVAEQIRILKELEGTLVGADQRHLDRALQLLRQASHFFQAELLPHFGSEEQGMFAVFREHLPKGSTVIYELQSEHEQMRRLCGHFREQLRLLRHRRHLKRRALLAHLQALCEQITALLSRHVEREEQLVAHTINLEQQQPDLLRPDLRDNASCASNFSPVQRSIG
jgi:hemerythrin-like domain-containing protein